jgi:predicted nucleic acid-binding protein
MAKQPASVAPASLFVDSSAWLAFFSARDGRHADADRLMRYAIQAQVPLLTSSLVLSELHRLLLFRAGIRAAAAALDKIDASRNVTVKHTDTKTHQAARAWLAKLGDQAITYTDATSFALMAEHRCRAVLSFDKDFVIAGFTLWEGEP